MVKYLAEKLPEWSYSVCYSLKIMSPLKTTGCRRCCPTQFDNPSTVACTPLLSASTIHVRAHHINKYYANIWWKADLLQENKLIWLADSIWQGHFFQLIQVLCKLWMWLHGSAFFLLVSICLSNIKLYPKLFKILAWIQSQSLLI